MLKSKGLTGTAGSDGLSGSNWSDLISGLGGDDALYGLEGDDVIRGDGGNDSVWAGGGNDGVEGGEGDDTIYGENGDDVIDGGRGDDVLYGWTGNDVYLFGKGDGKDVIGGDAIYWWDGTIGFNVLQFKSGVTAGEVRLTRIGDGLVLSIEGTDDTITASNFFAWNDPNNGYNTLQEVRFAGGSSWDMAAMLKSKGLTGTAGSDGLSGSNWSDLISGLGGDDALYGLEGDDVLIGGLGNDQIIAGNGNDFLIGGAGNDQLFGGFGSDIYSFARGDGADVIVDNDAESGKFNRLNFGDDVAPSDVVASQDGDDLVLSILQSSDSMRVVDFYRSASPFNPCNSIQEIGFADGSKWGLSHFS
jgi:Ca2+-binding RTX toxin-like protein